MAVFQLTYRERSSEKTIGLILDAADWEEVIGQARELVANTIYSDWELVGIALKF